jgi:hypothetical protein
MKDMKNENAKPGLFVSSSLISGLTKGEREEGGTRLN